MRVIGLTPSSDSVLVPFFYSFIDWPWMDRTTIQIFPNRPFLSSSQWRNNGQERMRRWVKTHGDAQDTTLRLVRMPRIFHAFFSPVSQMILPATCALSRRYSSPQCPTSVWDDVWGHKTHTGHTSRGLENFATFPAYESLAIMTLLMNAPVIFSLASVSFQHLIKFRL